MSFRPDFSHDRFWASLASLVFFVLAILTVFVMFRQPIGPGTVIAGGLSLIFLCLGALLLYRLWSLHTLDYWVQRDAVHILWNGEEVIIPLPQILDVGPASVALRPAWLHWPLQWIQPNADERILAYATRPSETSLAINASDATYIISPKNPQAFVAAIKERMAFGPARRLKPVIYLSHWRQHWLLRDRLAQGLIFGGLLLGLFVLGYVTWRFPQLPATIALHFNTQGDPDLLSPRRTIFLIPSITLLLGFLNAAIGFALYDIQRFLSYLLWSASVILQIAAWLIAANLINLAVRG